MSSVECHSSYCQVYHMMMSFHSSFVLFSSSYIASSTLNFDVFLYLSNSICWAGETDGVAYTTRMCVDRIEEHSHHINIATEKVDEEYL